MAVTPASFRTAFTAFANATTYPDAQVQVFIDLAGLMLDANRWGTWLDWGTQLFVAHNLAVMQAAALAAAKGGVPGAVTGPQTEAHVDKVGYGTNPGLVMDPKNGWWNLSSYGLQYIYYVKLVGAGPIQVGVGTVPDTLNGQAWQGAQTYFPYTGW